MMMMMMVVATMKVTDDRGVKPAPPPLPRLGSYDSICLQPPPKPFFPRVGGWGWAAYGWERGEVGHTGEGERSLNLKDTHTYTRVG